MTVSPAKVAELIKIPFGVWTWVGPRNPVLDGGSYPLTGKGTCGAKVADPRHTQTCPMVDSDSAGCRMSTVQMAVGVGMY